MTVAIVNEITEQCACSLSTMDVFGDSISCDNAGAVIYRGGFGTSTQLDAEEISTILSRWIAQTSMLTVDGSPLQIDHNCPLILSSFDDPTCSSTSPDVPISPSSEQNIAPLLAGIIGGVIVLVVCATVTVILVIKCRGKTDKIRYALLEGIFS